MLEIGLGVAILYGVFSTFAAAWCLISKRDKVYRECRRKFAPK